MPSAEQLRRLRKKQKYLENNFVPLAQVGVLGVAALRAVDSNAEEIVPSLKLSFAAIMADALSGLATPQELAVIDAALQNFERNSRDLEGLSGLVGVAVAKEIAVSCSRSVDRALGELCEQTYGEADNRDAEFLTLRRRIHEDLT